jgi:threonine-phosphate decarboxylase
MTAYPDLHYVALKEAIADYVQVDVPAIAIGSGVMPLLGAALSALRPHRCLVPVPAFTEYRKVLDTCGVECCAFTSTQDTGFLLDGALLAARLKASGAQAVLLANPQSPSGRLMRAEELLRLHEAASALGATTIVDEAFIDYAPLAMGSEKPRTDRSALLDQILCDARIARCVCGHLPRDARCHGIPYPCMARGFDGG